MIDKRPSVRQEAQLRRAIAYDINKYRNKINYYRRSPGNEGVIKMFKERINDLRFISYEDYAWCKLQEEVY